MRKIYDCFTFFNEFDILEIRLRELYDHVDHFVIAEANKTHSGKDKSFYLLDNFERFAPWKDKIIHVPVTDMPGVTQEWGRNPTTGLFELRDNYWHNERHQRNCLVRALNNAQPTDVIMLGDVDELVRPHCADFIRFDFLHRLWAFRMPMFNYRFNYMWTKPLIFQVQGQALTIECIKEFPNLSYIREVYGRIWLERPKMFDNGVEFCFPHAGWHFSSLGDTKFVANKLRHVADYFPEVADTINLDDLISQRTSQVVQGSVFEPVILDDYFPKSVFQNQERYKDLILTDGTQTVLDKLSIIPMTSAEQF